MSGDAESAAAEQGRAAASGGAAGGAVELEDRVDHGLLCIGDEFCLQTTPNEFGTVGFVSANPAGGDTMDVYSEVLTGDPDEVHPSRPMFSRFMLHTANQYAASRQLQKWEERTGGDQAEREVLLQGTVAETAVNKTELRLATGQRAVYGGVYQMLAPNCGLFLTTRNQPATELRTALRCSMTDSEKRTKFPWFVIKPGFRTRSEGEPVRMGDTIVLASVKMPGMYVHANMDPGGDQKKTVTEVNLHEDASRFKIIPAAKHWMRQEENSVRAGSYCALFQRQSEAYIHRDHAFSRLDAADGTPEPHKCEVVLYSPHGQVDAAATESSRTLLGAKSTSMQIPSVERKVDILWQLSRPTMLWSGSLVEPNTREDTYSLRDAVSGQFLSEVTEGGDGHLVFVDSDKQASAQWFLRCFDPDAKEILTERTGFWIENSQTGRSLAIGGEQERSEIKKRLLTKDTVDEDDIFVFRQLPPDWLKSFGGVLPQVNLMHKFCEAVKSTTVETPNPEKAALKQGLHAQAMLRSEPELLALHAVYLIPSSVIKPAWSGTIPAICEDLLMQLTSSNEKNVLVRNGKVNEVLQEQLTGLQMPHFLLEELLPALFSTVSAENIKRKIFGPHILRMVQYSFRILAMLAKSHPGNSTYLFSKIDTISKYLLGYGFGVADCVTEIFSDEIVLMRQAEDRLIKQFWDLAAKLREVRYIMFLSALVVDSSSGKAKPVKYNQDRVSRIIRESFEEADGEAAANMVSLYRIDLEKTLAHVVAHDAKGKAKFKAAAEATKKVYGVSENGLNTRFLLEGKATIEDIIRYKAELDFHTGLIELTANLCMGRHRESIDFFLADPRVNMSYRLVLSRSFGTHESDQKFENGIPSKIRCAYVLLMRTLFVDREPFEYNAPVQTSRIMPPLGDDEAAAEQRLRTGNMNPSKTRRTIIDPYASLPGVERPTKGFTDLRKGILAVFNDVENIVVDDMEHNLFLGSVVTLAHEMLLFGIFDQSTLPDHLFDGVMTLGDESIQLGQELLTLLNGQHDDVSGLADGGAASDVADAESMRFDPRYPETSTVMELRKHTLALIVDLFGLRASKKIQLLLNAVTENRSVYDVEIDGSGNGSTVESARSGASAMAHFDNPLEDEAAAGVFDTESPHRRGGKPSTDSDSTDKRLSSQRSVDGGSQAASTDYERYKDTQQVQIAKAAMDEANKVRVYSGGVDDDVELTTALLDMLRYNQDLDLCFGAFNALVFFISQNFVFAQTLKRVTVLGTDLQAAEFLAARRDVSEFRRLRKWLHKKQECTECIDIINKIIADWCATTSGQNLLRDLNLEEYLLRVLRMRMKIGESVEAFKLLLRRCMELVAAFCRNNSVNQERFATHMESILLKLLRDKDYYNAAATMLGAVVEENEVVSVSFSAAIVAEVGTLAMSPDHGRSIMLLDLLEALLVVNGKPVEVSQVKVCKGAYVCGALIETDGDLAENEWCAPGEKGPAMSRVETIRCAALDDNSAACERCVKAIAYYSKCLELLGICARGDMPSTELLCASILSFEECIARLNELYSLQKEIGTSVFLSEIKAELLTFFLDVFVDTTSEHILLSVRRERNGIWTVGDGATELPIATRMLAEMTARVDELKAIPADERPRSPSPASKSSGRGRVDDGSAHLFEEAVMFFIHYACCVGPRMAAPEEQYTVRDAYKLAQQIAAEAQALSGFTEKERTHIDQLCIVTDAFLDNDSKRLRADIILNNLFISHAASEPVYCENERAWQRFVQAAASTIPVKTVFGTNRLVGQGMMTLAQSIWMKPPDSDVDRYAGFLVKPLRARLRQLKQNVLLGARGDIPKLLTVLDTVRAIPFAATAYSQEKLVEMFDAFVQVKELDATTNPYLAAVQKEMVSQGWAMLCFEMLVADELHDLHLTALRLLLAMTGGGSTDVQDTILFQLTDMEWCPQEIFAAGARKLLQKCVQDLKALRKHQVLMRANKASDTKTESIREPSAVGHAVETLTLLSNCCLGAHTNMQDYIRDQPGHREQFNLIADVIFFISQLERDLRSEVIGEHNADGSKNQPAGSKPKQREAGSNHVSATVAKSYAAFHFLCSMATGPHFGNQLAIASSDIIPVINRMLAYSMYDCVDDMDTEGNTNTTVKGQIHVQIASLLLILLEGVPRKKVVKRILGALDWGTFGSHLSVLKDVMKQGVIASRDSTQEATSAETLFDNSTSSRGNDDPTKKQFKHDVQFVPLYVCNPKQHIYAQWLRKEAFSFFTIVERVRIAGEEMEKSGHHSYKNCLEPLRLLTGDGEMMSFFNERVGQVEVIRDGNLERLFFLRPPNSLVKRDKEMLARNCTRVADAAPRQDSTEKLHHFLEGAMAAVAVLDSQDQVSEIHGRSLGAFLPQFFAWCDKKSPTMIISLMICLNLMVSYTRCNDFISDLSGVIFDTNSNLTDCDSPGGSLDRATYSRSQQWPLPIVGPVGYELAMILGTIHVALTVLRAYSFLVIRFPVLLEIYDRRDRLDYIKGEQTSVNVTQERESFIGTSVLVYGLPYMVPDDSLATVLATTMEVATGTHRPHVQALCHDYVRRLFNGYGDIGVAQVVRVRQEADIDGSYQGVGNNSWALVKFEKLSAVHKLMEDQKKSLHPSDSNKEPSPLGVKASLRPDAQVESVSIRVLTVEEVDRSTTLKTVTREAMLEYNIAGKKLGLTQGAAHTVQSIADKFQVGRVLPISMVVRFRWDPEVHESLMDIALALLGFFYNPLFFSYHLFKIAKIPGAKIVVLSMTHNIVRLAVALLLSLLFAWIFAISGMLVFSDMHSSRYTENEGGPCGNLLTCFVSYSYAGLMMDGLNQFLPRLSFPVDATDVFGHDTTKIVWELLFFLVSTLIGSIITGIICDTFGELRAAQDDAAMYRSSTNFITGISFSRTGTTLHHPSQQSTNYIQYAWLLLYLRQRRGADLTPLEEMVRSKVENGDISWLPDGRCSLLENDAISADTSMEAVHSALRDMQGEHDDLRDDVVSVQSMMAQSLEQLSALNKRLDQQFPQQPLRQASRKVANATRLVQTKAK